MRLVTIAMTIGIGAAQFSQGPQTAVAAEKQTPRKSAPVLMHDQKQGAKKPGVLKVQENKAAEGGNNEFTHRLPSRTKDQKKPDSTGRVKMQFPW